jgi:cell division protein FtsZ
MEITDYIQHEAGSGADIIWGNGTDETLGNKISITLIATGFDSQQKTTPTALKPNVVVYPLNGQPEQQHKPAEPVKPEPAPLEEIRIVHKLHEEDNSITSEPSNQAAEPQRSFVFEINNQVSEPLASGASEEANEAFTYTPVNATRKAEPGFDFLRDFRNAPQHDDANAEETARQEERARMRLDKFNQVSVKISTPEGLAELENQPAYLRRNVELKETPSSDSSEVSRFTLFKSENKSVEIRQNNSYLHDQAD